MGISSSHLYNFLYNNVNDTITSPTVPAVQTVVTVQAKPPTPKALAISKNSEYKLSETENKCVEHFANAFRKTIWADVQQNLYSISEMANNILARRIVEISGLPDKFWEFAKRDKFQCLVTGSFVTAAAHGLEDDPKWNTDSDLDIFMSAKTLDDKRVDEIKAIFNLNLELDPSYNDELELLSSKNQIGQADPKDLKDLKDLGDSLGSADSSNPLDPKGQENSRLLTKIIGAIKFRNPGCKRIINLVIVNAENLRSYIETSFDTTVTTGMTDGEMCYFPFPDDVMRLESDPSRCVIKQRIDKYIARGVLFV